MPDTEELTLSAHLKFQRVTDQLANPPNTRSKALTLHGLKQYRLTATLSYSNTVLSNTV
ncbi:MAG: hypothetical protein ABJZ55_08820 [Fuerstiella sp.]